MEKDLIEKLKIKLIEEKESLEKELESFAKKDPNVKDNWDAKYPDREDTDKDEDADGVGEYENKVALERNLETRLKSVNNALEKMENETYGICEGCGKKIDEERLLACPEAKTCLKCNEK